MQKVKKGPYDGQARKKDIRVSVIMLGIAVLFLALFIFPFYSLFISLLVSFIVIIMLVPITFLAVWEIQKTPNQTRNYPMFEHRTNSTSSLYMLVGTIEKHDLRIVKHRWSGKVEVSVDSVKQCVHEPKKSKDGLKIKFNMGTGEIHAVEITHSPSASGGIAIMIDGSLDYIFN